MRLTVRSSTALGLGVVLIAGAALYARYIRSSRAAAGRAAAVSAAVARGDPILRVPHAPGPITLDGDTDDPGWLRPPGPARTGDYVSASGQPARPYSDTRVVWGDGYLYLALYAADEDIETRTDQPDGPLWLDDAFRVVFSRPGVEYAIEVSPKAIITDSIRRNGGEWDFSWDSGAHASKEIDGSINNPSNMDEEWAIELAIPFDSLGMKGERGETIAMFLTRCDTPRADPRADPTANPKAARAEPRVCAGWGEVSADHRIGRIVLQ